MPLTNLDSLDVTFDPDDPEGFRSAHARLGPLLGAERTGISLYVLPPGQALCPYHYEYGEEEWALVLSGRPTLRTPDGVKELAPDDIALFVRGPDGAHQLRNDSAEEARVLLFSDVVHPTATAYPDSGKVGVYTGREGEDLIARRADAAGYYDGEPGA